MNERPQSIWKKFWRGCGAWLFLVAFLALPAFVGAVIFVALLQGSPDVVEHRVVFLALLVGAATVTCGLLFHRQLAVLSYWLFTWRNARRLVVGAAVLATLLALFYAEENWRGRGAWEQRKRELAAKGELLDWSACIPARIPDDENIIKAPKMAKWFIKPKPSTNWSSELSERLNTSAAAELAKRNASIGPVLLARVSVVPLASTAINEADLVVPFDVPDAHARLSQFIEGVVGPNAKGVQGFAAFVRQPLSQIKPARIVIQTDRPCDATTLTGAVPADLFPAELGRLRIEPDAAAGVFRVLLAAKPTLSAEEYLAWSDRFVPDLDLIRQALKRPHIRMDDDYQRPFEIPMVNFLAFRTVAQTAAQRAQCCLLLGRSEQACRELSLVFESRYLLTAKPTLLVSAMIDVAISGLYATTVAEGFRLHAWREPEVVALQEQLQQFNLLQSVAESFRTERIAACRTFETTSAGEMAKLLSFGRPEEGFWKRITNPVCLLLKCAPRGWVYLNLAATASLGQRLIDVFDSTRQVITPQNAKLTQEEFEKLAHRRSPSTILAAIAATNFIRASQTTARNQTKVNQALIVCGLERYHLTHGGYPDNLDALVPQFLDRLPHDVIGGGPLKYRRIDASHFQLYSVGWNEKDEGGTPGKDSETGDWGWPMEAK